MPSVPRDRRHKEPRRFGKIAPDVKAEILVLAEATMNMPNDAPDRPKRVRKLLRLIADQSLRMSPQDMACLAPMGGTSPDLIDLPLRWHPYHINKEAIERSGLCNGIPEGDAMEACRDANYGQAVMWAEPELAGQCRSANAPGFDADAVAECTKRKFLDAWSKDDGVVSSTVADNWVLSAGCGPKSSPTERKNTLRDRLRTALGQDDRDVDKSTAEQPISEKPVLVNVAPAAPPEPLPADNDEAYCNFMAREVARRAHSKPEHCDPSRMSGDHRCSAGV